MGTAKIPRLSLSGGSLLFTTCCATGCCPREPTGAEGVSFLLRHPVGGLFGDSLVTRNKMNFKCGFSAVSPDIWHTALGTRISVIRY